MLASLPAVSNLQATAHRHTKAYFKVDNICLNKLGLPKFGWIHNPTELDHVEGEKCRGTPCSTVQNKTLNHIHVWSTVLPIEFS